MPSSSDCQPAQLKISQIVMVPLVPVTIGELGPVMSQYGQGLEQEVNFTPVSVGENQRVEFLLFKEGESEPYRSLHLWIDVRQYSPMP